MSKSSNIVEERLTVQWTAEEKKDIPFRYGCEILLEKATAEQLKDPAFPSDANIVTYKVDGEIHNDLCRGTNIKIFDLYFDKFGQGAVQSIVWGYGKINPRMWGYKAPEKKRRK